MTTASEIVDRLLETEDFDDEVNAQAYVDRYSDQIAAAKARGDITFDKALTCNTFYHREVKYKSRGRQNDPYEARRNGATKTWKRQPGKFYIPIKIGYRDFGYIDNDNAHEWSWRPDFKEAWEDYAEKTRRAQQSAEINHLQNKPLGPDTSQQALPLPPQRDPNQPELFNETRSRLRKLGVL